MDFILQIIKNAISHLLKKNKIDNDININSNNKQVNENVAGDKVSGNQTNINNNININNKKQTYFSEKMTVVINTINECRSEDDKISFYKIQELSGGKIKFADLDTYSRKIEPDIDFIRDISSVLGINKEWLKGTCNEKKMFYISRETRIKKLKDLLSGNFNGDIRKINIIIEDKIPYSTAILVKENDVKYVYLDTSGDYNFELCNPSGPNKEINYNTISFLRIYFYLKQKQYNNKIKSYNDLKTYKNQIWVGASSYNDNIYFIDAGLYEKMVNGEVYVGNVLNQLQKKEQCYSTMILEELFKEDGKECGCYLKPPHDKWFNNLKKMTDEFSVNKWGKNPALVV